MWLFLSVWTFNFICTLTALLMVWVYEIAAPVSWALIVPSLACDIWRLATPDDYAEDGPHHPIWHSPNTPLWILGWFCFGILLLAPLLRFSCFPMINGLIEPYFGLSNSLLKDVGGACKKKYGNLVYLYFSDFPIVSILFLIYFMILSKRTRSYFYLYHPFKQSEEVKPRHAGIIFGFMMAFFVKFLLSYIGFNVVGRKIFTPVSDIFSLFLLSVFTSFSIYMIAAGHVTFCYANLKLEKSNEKSE